MTPRARSLGGLVLETAAPDLAAWLDEHAEALDATQDLAAEVLPRLGAAGLLRIGVPAAWGGSGTTVEAIEAIASVARRSLTAAFVFWGQRAFIEYLLRSENEALRSRCLPALLAGEHAGATGLSNVMKYLSDIEPLKMHASARDGSTTRWTLNGDLPWITNLRREGFIVAAAFDHGDGRPPSIFAVPHDAPGVTRGDDLDLIALRSSNTAALSLNNAVLDADWLIAGDAVAFLSRARPAFLGMQCGMSIGLARRALEVAADSGPAVRAATDDAVTRLTSELDELTHCLYEGVESGMYISSPAAQFEARIGLASVVSAAVQIEVLAAGGRGYLRGASGLARRAREAAFVPIVTPSIVQLKNQLARHRQSRQTSAT